MSAPRPTQFIALRRLAANGTRHPRVQNRQLHMTEPKEFASPLLTAERPASSNLPRDIAGLRAECKNRNIPFSGTQQELLARLSAADGPNSARAFTTSMTPSKRPTASEQQQQQRQQQQQKPSDPPLTRHFNTSRALKAVNDSSTIDFAFLPADLVVDPDDSATATATVMRVPLLPTNFDAPRTGAHGLEAETVVMKPQINALAGGSGAAHVSTMAEIHDNAALDIDFTGMAERVAKAMEKRVGAPVAQQGDGVVRTLWRGILEDLRGVGEGVGGRDGGRASAA